MTLTLCSMWLVVLRQAQSTRFPSVVGTMLQSEVETNSSSRGTSFNVRVKYRYDVTGVRYMGTNYRFLNTSFHKRDADAIVKSCPPGQRVDVYYDPARPEEAVLQPGIDGSDLLWSLAPLPFGAGMFAGWRWLYRTARFRRTGGVPVRDDGVVARSGMGSSLEVLLATGISAGLTGFLLVVAVGLATGGHPPLFVAVGAWLLVLTAAVWALIASIHAWINGGLELVIDRRTRTLTLPAIDGRAAPIAVPWHSIAAVEVEHCTRETDFSERRRGSRTRTFPHFAPVVRYVSTDGTESRARVSERLSETAAHAVAAWVRGLVGEPSADPVRIGSSSFERKASDQR